MSPATDDAPPTVGASKPLAPRMRPEAPRRALLLVLAACTVAAAPVDTLESLLSSAWMVTLWVGGLAALLAWSGYSLDERRHSPADGAGGDARRRWKLVATAAFLPWAVGTLVEHGSNPTRGLFVLLGVVAFLSQLWFAPLPRPSRRLTFFQRRPNYGDLLAASSLAALFGFDEWQLNLHVSPLDSCALAFAYGVPVALAAARIRRHARAKDNPVTLRPGFLFGLALAGFFALLPLATAASYLASTPVDLTPLGLLSPLTMFVLFAAADGPVSDVHATSGLDSPRMTLAPPQGLLDVVLARPAWVLVLSFVLLSIIGTLLLSLPVAATDGRGISWLDAAFTSFSATCVTGLIVVDTPVAFTGFGQGALLLLIQVGGLGIMVFSAAAVVLLGRRLSLTHERAAVDMVGAKGRSGLIRSIRIVLLVTFATEALAALLMFGGFLALGEEAGPALWRAVFTAISAFCNAGFALQSDSMVGYADDPFILAVVSATIIVGGLGPAIVAAAFAWNDAASRTLHARLALWTTGVLIVVPALLFAIFEWNQTLAGMGSGDKLMNALFQSVTLRTAGFNSVDLAQVAPATWSMMLVVMFVGGSPGSTAGGVKTTTVAVVVLSIVAVVRGRSRVEAFGRTLSLPTVLRATAVTTLAAFGVFAALTAVQLTQTIPLDQAAFETVSALATVGLSTGATGALDEIGKVLIIACMFIGRIGPLTLFVFLTSNVRAHPNRRYPEESVPIG